MTESDGGGISASDDSESHLHSANHDRFVSLFGEDFQNESEHEAASDNDNDADEMIEMAMVEAEETDLANYVNGTVCHLLTVINIY